MQAVGKRQRKKYGIKTKFEIMPGKISDLYVANPVVSFQDEDLMEIAVWDGVSAFASGAFTWQTLKEQMPTLYTFDGVLTDERTVDMDGFNLFFTNGGLIGIADDDTVDLSARLHIFANGERTTLGVGEFEGVEPLAESVFAMQDGAFMCIIPFGTDVSSAANIHWLLGLNGTAVSESFYSGADLRIAFSSQPTTSRIEAYDDADNLVFTVDEDGNTSVGSGATPVSFQTWGNIGFNKVPQVPLITTAETAGAAYTSNEQDMIQQLWDMAFHYGLFNL